MYIPVEVTARNFQSFENLHYKFRQGESVLIQGENLSDEGQESNGSGKSTILEVVFYCYLGTSSSGKRDLKLIRRGAAESNISHTLFNPINSSTLVIERDLFLKKSSTLRITINGEDQKFRFATIDEGNKLILQLIGISSDDLKNFYLINRDRFTSFFKLSDTQSRSLISRFSNISFIDKVYPVIDKELIIEQEFLSAVEKEKVSIESTLLSLNTKVETYNEQIVSIKENNSPEKLKEAKEQAIQSIKEGIIGLEREIESLTESNTKLNTSIKSFEESKIETEKKRKSVEKAITALGKISYAEKIEKIVTSITGIDVSLSTLESKRKVISGEIGSYEKELGLLEVQLAGLITCPKCSHEFFIKEDQSIDEVKGVIEEIKQEVVGLVKKLTKEGVVPSKELEDQKITLRKGLLILNAQEDKKRKLVSRIEMSLRSLSVTNIETQIASLNRSVQQDLNSIQSKQLSISNKTLEIKAIEEDPNDNTLILANLQESISKTEILIKNQKVLLEEANTEIEKQQEVMENIRIWALYFKQFYIYLTNYCLKNIQDLCNIFLERIDTDLRVQIEGFKYLADGTTSEKITTVILRNNIIEDDYRSFSGGERGKLVLSTILAFQELINNSCPNGGLDLLFIDEILDSVDGVGMKSFIQALNSLKKTIHLTTHISVKERDENVIMVRKVNDKSYILN